MRRRVLAVALPHLAAEHRLRREGLAGADHPFAVAGQEGGALRIVSATPAGVQAGVLPGMGLADARALCPRLATRPHEPERHAAFRRALARWAGRFSPLVGEEHVPGAAEALVLDITGCAHLFGGERGLAEAVAEGLGGLGLTARLAIADTKGAAWALAHHGGAGLTIAEEGHARAAIAGLPVAALRLTREVAEALGAVGLGDIGALAGVQRAQLARRFGIATVKRLDQALGAEPEPVAPARAAPRFSARLTLPEPVGLQRDVEAGLERLLERVCARLEEEERGARALHLALRRVDGEDARAAIRLARPMRDPMRLRTLFAPKIAGIDAGFGIDAMRLEATETEPLSPRQAGDGRESDRLADLLSRIGNRIGFENLTRLLPAESHIPERAFTVAAAAWSEPGRWAATPRLRPLTLLPPEAVETLGAPAPHPAAAPPPARFRWRGRVLATERAQGPERIAPEWWWDDPDWRSGPRDYWHVETAEGPRLWLFHTPAAPHPGWHVHGSFA